MDQLIIILLAGAIVFATRKTVSNWLDRSMNWLSTHPNQLIKIGVGCAVFFTIMANYELAKGIPISIQPNGTLSIEIGNIWDFIQYSFCAIGFLMLIAATSYSERYWRKQGKRYRYARNRTSDLRGSEPTADLPPILPSEHVVL
jgi:formate hydrogenlyase subunit 3/multisubunit Na+/H+ antiporter MnhD subunit